MRAIPVRGVRLAAIPLVATVAAWGGLATPAATAYEGRPSAPVWAFASGGEATAGGPVAEGAALHAARLAGATAFAAHKAASAHAAWAAAANQAARQARAAYAARASRTLVRPSAPGAARLLGERMSAARGWAGAQFGCLDALWTNESGWSVTAANVASGSYGIPQAQPGYKMAAAGSGWRTDAATQIAWGLWYIASAYGSPCSAWAFWQVHAWY